MRHAAPTAGNAQLSSCILKFELNLKHFLEHPWDVLTHSTHSNKCIPPEPLAICTCHMTNKFMSHAYDYLDIYSTLRHIIILNTFLNVGEVHRPSKPWRWLSWTNDIIKINQGVGVMNDVRWQLFEVDLMCWRYFHERVELLSDNTPWTGRFKIYWNDKNCI